MSPLADQWKIYLFHLMLFSCVREKKLNQLIHFTEQHLAELGGFN